MDDQILTVDQCYENLGNAIIVRALIDYLVGEIVLEDNGGDIENVPKQDMDKVRYYNTAKGFLFGPRLAIFTRIPPETLVSAAKKSEKISTAVNRAFQKVRA